MVPQVTAMCKSAFYHLRKISLIRKHLTFDGAQLLVHVLITSKLDYCIRYYMVYPSMWLNSSNVCWTLLLKLFLSHPSSVILHLPGVSHVHSIIFLNAILCLINNKLLFLLLCMMCQTRRCPWWRPFCSIPTWPYCLWYPIVSSAESRWFTCLCLHPK